MVGSHPQALCLAQQRTQAEGLRCRAARALTPFFASSCMASWLLPRRAAKSLRTCVRLFEMVRTNDLQGVQECYHTTHTAYALRLLLAAGEIAWAFSRMRSGHVRLLSPSRPLG